jgi:hypothetical protein
VISRRSGAARRLQNASAMKTPRLRRVLGNLLLAVPFVSIAACQCPDPVQRTIYWKGTRSDVQALVDSCRTTGDCYDLCQKIAEMREDYVTSLTSCEYVEDVDGTPGVTYELAVECVGGRKPAGLTAARPGGGDAIGAWFARLAHLEAASIVAFDRLAAELSAHGAPSSLVRAARAAILDEAHHAFLTGAIDRRAAASPRRPPVGQSPPGPPAPATPRDLEAFAVENAVEGCVRETWGAVVASVQAAAAADPRIREAMSVISADEAKHAALAWEIDAWARTRLDAAAIARLDAARAAAVDALTVDDAPPALVDRAGHPDRATQLALLAAARRDVWS